MKKRTYLSAGLALLIGTLSVHASPGLSESRAVYYRRFINRKTD